MKNSLKMKGFERKSVKFNIFSRTIVFIVLVLWALIAFLFYISRIVTVSDTFTGSLASESSIDYDIVPKDYATLPEYSFIVPEDSAKIQEDLITVPEESIVVPQESATKPEDFKTLPKHSILPNDTITLQNDSIIVPQDSATASQEDFLTFPNNPAILPEASVILLQDSVTSPKVFIASPKVFNASPNDSTTSPNDFTTLPNDSIMCYQMDGERLPDITTVEVRKGRSIFFHETSCKSYARRKIVIATRQACAVESAAKKNPNLDVYLTFSSPGVIKFEGTESDRILQKLQEYDNIKILHLNYETYTKGTPLEKLYETGEIAKGDYAISHASDVLRYLSMYKYGGIYLDMDIVVIKSLEDLKSNFAGLESEEVIGSAVLGFDWQGVGHRFAKRCVMDLKDNFNAYNWADNGPGVITRNVKRLCSVNTVMELLDKPCRAFKVLPMNAFYPVPYSNWMQFFDPINMEYLRKFHDTYTVHLWNKLSEGTKIERNSETLYTYFAERHCPRVFAESGQEF